MVKTPDIPGTHPTKQGRKKITIVLLSAVKWVLFLTVLFFVGRALVRQFANVSWSDIRFGASSAVLAVVCLFAARALRPTAHYLLLSRFKRPPALPVLTSALWVAHLGKYVPGKFGSVVGAVWLLRRHKVPGQVAVSTILIVDGLTIILGIIVALPLTLWEPVRTHLPMAWLWCIILIMAGLVCLHPRLFGKVGNFLLKRFRYQPLPWLPKVHDYLGSIAVLLVYFFLLGLSYWVMSRSLAPAPIRLLPIFVCTIAATSIAGLLAFFAPAGLGVQEGLLLIILGPLIGGTSAAILIVVMRFVQIVVEVILATVGLVFLRLHPAGEPAETELTRRPSALGR